MSDEKRANDERGLAAAIKASAPRTHDEPGFDDLFARAEREYRSAARRPLLAAAVASVAVLVVVLSVLQPAEVAPPPEWIEVDGLLDTTSWVAPSDILLPEHEFDIFTEMPTLIESTDSAGGALL